MGVGGGVLVNDTSTVYNATKYHIPLRLHSYMRRLYLPFNFTLISSEIFLDSSVHSSPLY